MWLTVGLGVGCLVLIAVCVGQWLRLRRQAEELAAAEHWKETWQAEATSATQQASAAVAELTKLRRQHEELQKHHEAVRLLYVERTQTALWAGVVRFLMN